VVTSNEKSEIALNEIRDAILSAGNLYSKRPDLFRLFGDFDGTKDLLFKVGCSKFAISQFYLRLLFRGSPRGNEVVRKKSYLFGGTYCLHLQGGKRKPWRSKKKQAKNRASA
jgi:hypothetical protein